MLQLFRLETENQTALLTDGLLALEKDPCAVHHLGELMRAAHSLKGAARMVDLEPAVRVAHAMEDCFVSAQRTSVSPTPRQIDILLQGVDLLNRIAQTPDADISNWGEVNRQEMEIFLDSLAARDEPESGKGEERKADPAPEHSTGQILSSARESASLPTRETAQPDPSDSLKQAVRVTAETLSSLLGLAGESIVASRWLDTFTSDLLRLKRVQNSSGRSLQRLHDLLLQIEMDEQIKGQLIEVLNKESLCRQLLDQRLAELEMFDRRFISLSARLHQEVLDCRMRPFADGVRGLGRMVRDIARSLGKQAQLELVGESTPVDRDILERIEAPLGHLLRNAVDHGIEMPAERRRSGKPDFGTVRLEARHNAGMLLITVSDDGQGIEPDDIRRVVVEKNLAGVDVAERLSDNELLEFLFLPGFTMKEVVTDLSGRGVGLDVVQTLVKEVGGVVRLTSRTGVGTHFQLQLPLTLSVIRTLLVEIAGEPYAFPLNRIIRALRLPCRDIESVQGRQHFTLGDRQIGLVTAHQILDLRETAILSDELAVIVLGDTTDQYGVVIDRFLGERELTIRALDPRLGKVQDIGGAALMPDQTPVLIVDVEDMIRSIANLVSGQRLTRVGLNGSAASKQHCKNVLVVDDSLTVRELERKLIASKGYKVEIAVDGLDAWNAIRNGQYDLVITDVDMPRLDGIELVAMIRKDLRLQSLPVMIVSYKDREEDRQRGLEAGADYYLTKSSFHDESFLQAVTDLIGAPQE